MARPPEADSASGPGDRFVADRHECGVWIRAMLKPAPESDGATPVPHGTRKSAVARLDTAAPTGGAVPRPANPDAKGSRPPVAKAMSSLSGPDGGFLVPPAGAKVKRKRRAAACVARVLKSLEEGGLT